MRKSSQAAVVAAVAFLAGSAQAGTLVSPIDFSDTSTRQILVSAEISACTNSNPPTGTSAADAGCFVFAADPTAIFAPTPFPGTLENLGGTNWRLTIAAAVWEAVVQTAVGASPNCSNVNGVCTGSMTDLVVEFDSSMTGADVHAVNAGTGGVPANPLVYWQAKFFSTIVGELDIAAQQTDQDRPFYGDLVGNPFVVSCAGSGLPSPTGSLCDPPLETEPGLTQDPPNGTFLTAFAMTFNGVGRQVYAPLDWRLDEVPEPAHALMLLAGAATLALFRRRAS
jgi:hypothetical protein